MLRSCWTAERTGVLGRATQASLSLLFLLSMGCATESSKVFELQTSRSPTTEYSGPRYAVVLGNFGNRSPYRMGLFAPSEDLVGGQARAILESQLEESRRFQVLNRNNMEVLEREASLRGVPQALEGGQVAIAGDVTAFGRKTVGDSLLFGLLGEGKQQSAYAKVTLNIVDVRTSRVLISVQGAGEVSLSNREILGFGGRAGYDSTLNGKVLGVAIGQAVDALVVALENGAWAPTTVQ